MIGHKYTPTVGHTGSYAFGDHVRRNHGATVVELGIPPALAVGSVNSVHFNHTKVKPAIKNFLEKNHMPFEENMFQQNTTTDAFIYFRHEFSRWIYEFGSGKVYVLRDRRVTEGITKKQLEDDFGFIGYELKSIK